MKNICPLIFISIAAQAALLPPARAGAEAEDLLGIFDGNAAKISARSLIQAYTVTVPRQADVLPMPERPKRKPLYLLLAGQEEGRKSKFYTPQEIVAMIREDYGDDPSEADKKQIDKALAILQSTKLGAGMCNGVAYGCTRESLEKAGIRLRVKEIAFGANQSASGIVPPPIKYAGRTFIGLGKSSVSDTASSQKLALTLLHEMSHVGDLRRNKLGTMEKALYASEGKAFMYEIAGYDEIRRKHPGFSDSFYDFLVEVWAWKNESGPYPRNQPFTLPLGPGGTPLVVSSGGLLKDYMPGLSFWDSMERLVYVLWHSAYGDPPVNDELVKAIREAAREISVYYKSWRQNPSGAAPTVDAHTPKPTNPAPKPPKPPEPPKPPKPPHNTDDDNTHEHDTDEDGGGSQGGSGSGGGFNPGTYDPHFQDGI